jgi:hypothetical protein
LKNETVTIVNGIPTVTRTVTTVQVVEEQLPGWLASISTMEELIGGLISQNVPFSLRSPGAPAKGGVFDRFRITLYANKKIILDAYTEDGLVLQAYNKLRNLTPSRVTLNESIAAEKRDTEIETLQDVFASVTAMDTAHQNEIRDELLDEGV